VAIVPQELGTAISLLWQEVTEPSKARDKSSNSMYIPKSEYDLNLRYLGFKVIIK
jgi:hypothetical protein